MQKAQTFGGRGIPRIDAPARLVVAATAKNELDPVLDMLAAAGFGRDDARGGNRLPSLVELPDRHDMKAVGEWLQANDDAHLLLLFNAPVPWIGGQMAGGVAPAEALKKWRADAEHVLSVVRQNRRRLSLLPLEGPLTNPAAFMQTLGERFGRAIQAPRSTEQPFEPPGPIFRMMAENAVWQSLEARHQAAELEANALPMSPVHGLTLPSVDEVFEEFNQVSEQAEFEHKKWLSELTKLKEAEAAAVKKASENKSDPLREEKPKLEARIKDLQEENELLLQQFHHVQEELESYFLSEQSTRKELAAAHETVDAMCNSKSWKITRPLRWFLEKFMGAEKAVR